MPTRDIWRSRWAMPLFCLFLGALMFAAFAIGDEIGQGVFSFGVMAALGAVFVIGRRSETLRGLGGPERDERWAMIDLRATAITGGVMIAFVIGAFLYEIASGGDATPYARIGAVGGIAYIVAIAVLRRRS